MKDLLNKLRAGHWPVFLISMVSAITNLFLPVVLVRILDPEDIGIYKIFFLYAQSITFLSLTGGPLYSVYYWIGKKDNAQKYVEHAWILSFSLSFICAAVGLLFSFQLSRIISITETQTILLLLSAITAAPASFYGEYLIAKGKRINGSLFNSGFEILKGVVIVTLVYYTRHINAAFWGFTGLFLIKLCLAMHLGKKEGILDFKLDTQRLKEVWKYCAPLSIAGALGFFLEKVDMILLSSQLSPEHFAFYSMGCLLVPPLYILEMSVQKVLVPALSRSYHDDDKLGMIQHYRKAQSDIAYLMIPAVFGLIIFNRPIIEILFTSQYMDSAVFLKVYALTYLAYIIPHDAIPRATGQTRWVLKMYLLLTPLSILVVYVCAGQWGAMGALISSMIFFFIPKIPGLIYSSRITQFAIPKLIAWKSLGLFVGLNLVLTALCYMFRPMFETEKMWFLVLSPFYAAIYLAAVNIIRHFKAKHEIEA
ncbi:oligosaccharide flippase family protein [Bacteriovorax sp. PP10]|uniref:Oligosaccharide flippase family protein n=1 Tax=Bacteriovorax antarcticus TaxID=3088717 RepID=A0ABU5VTI5_9BACT|nr:oligosaccharide flippase family protein [Bacteriovorax sp. PP10]MEA9355703.1 oligosaccharide flippase family protein [Bacteriovorax sp. PP10]